MKKTSTYIRTLPSSPPVAIMYGLTGFQWAELIAVPLWASITTATSPERFQIISRESA